MPATNPTPNVSSRYGAPMGRYTGNPEPDAQGKFSLRRVSLDSGGYDSGGAYWGHGEPLYWYCSADGTAEGFLRAWSRDEAKAAVLEECPGATFYR